MNEALIGEVRDRVIRVVKVVAENYPRPIGGGTRLLEDLALDSITRVELFARVADEFGLEVDPDRAMNVQTVDDACRFVMDRLQAGIPAR